MPGHTGNRSRTDQLRPMISLPNTLAAWNTPGFREVFKQESAQLDATLLPLQQSLERSSHVADSPLGIIPLAFQETPNSLRIKAGISYAGIIAGCSCTDDPTPMSEQAEYCEVWFEINKATAEATVSLLTA